MAKYNESNSIIGEGSVFEGKFYISGSLRIDGKFEGEIKTDETLFVGETGKVKTDIQAKEVILSGTLIGDIQADHEVRLTETGRMLGNIVSPSLQLAKGVVIKGSINITGGQKKDSEKIIEESFGGTKEIDKKTVA
ncbi:MAG: polymer-forming cytoskeletal protein [Spirochaetia bacterium]|nr:polymer-forming cytoskeletal protein [Spirochaetia bacterium]